MGGRDGGADDRAARLAAQLRANLRRRKAQAKGRDDLSGLDPKRTDTPLNRPDPGERDDVED
ncbi:MAG: hypothetical protein AAGF90_17655 [Pseudomonadota bacterium]